MSVTCPRCFYCASELKTHTVECYRDSVDNLLHTTERKEWECSICGYKHGLTIVCVSPKADEWNVPIQCGDKVTWLYENNSGWGVVGRIPATVVKLGKKRVQIEAPLRSGGTKLVWVAPEKLERQG